MYLALWISLIAGLSIFLFLMSGLFIAYYAHPSSSPVYNIANFFLIFAAIAIYALSLIDLQ